MDKHVRIACALAEKSAADYVYIFLIVGLRLSGNANSRNSILLT